MKKLIVGFFLLMLLTACETLTQGEDPDVKCDKGDTCKDLEEIWM